MKFFKYLLTMYLLMVSVHFFFKLNVYVYTYTSVYLYIYTDSVKSQKDQQVYTNLVINTLIQVIYAGRSCITNRKTQVLFSHIVFKRVRICLRRSCHTFFLFWSMSETHIYVVQTDFALRRSRNLTRGNSLSLQQFTREMDDLVYITSIQISVVTLIKLRLVIYHY